MPFDEWETVYRERLQVERDLVALEIDTSPGTTAVERKPSVGAQVVALGTAALIAADAMLLAANLMRPRRRR